MADWIKTTTECDGLVAPSENSQALCRIRAGAEVAVLAQDDPRFVNVAYQGQPVYISRDCCTVFHSDSDRGPPHMGVAPAPQPQQTGPATPRRPHFSWVDLLVAAALALWVIGCAVAGVVLYGPLSGGPLTGQQATGAAAVASLLGAAVVWRLRGLVPAALGLILAVVVMFSYWVWLIYYLEYFFEGE